MATHFYQGDPELPIYDYADLFAIVVAEAAPAPTRGASNGPSKRAPPPQNIEAAGGRNNYFTSIAGSMRARNMSDEAILAALTAENDALEDKLPADEILGIVKSVARYEASEARFFTCSDTGNGERFAHHNPDLRYLPERDVWVYWNGFRWADDPRGTIAGYQAIATVRKIPQEAEACKDSEVRQAVLSWAKKSESADRLSCVLRVAKFLPDVKVGSTMFDRDAWVLNVENGILDLRTGQLLPHARSAMCAKIARVRFVAGARHAVLDKYLEQATGGDPAFIGFLQRAMGYSLTGDTGAECIFLVLGPGGSGKTTLVEAFKDLLGDYSLTTAARTLLEKKSDSGHTSDVARMHGRRMICTSEIAKGKRLDAALVKSLTGGERIVARDIYAADAEFLPMGKFWLAANDAPGVADDDSGMWRRIIRVPFTRVIPEAERDPKIKEMLRKDPAARSALLSWALQGCLDWQSRGCGRQGLGVPPVVVAATKAYQAEQNPLRDFLDECCVLENGTTAVSDMRKAYAEYCRSSSIKPMPPFEFNQRMESLGCARVVGKPGGFETKSVKCWSGVTLVSAKPNAF